MSARAPARVPRTPAPACPTRRRRGRRRSRAGDAPRVAIPTRCPLDGDSSEDELLARLDLASSAPLAAARRGARDPLVRRASARTRSSAAASCSARPLPRARAAPACAISSRTPPSRLRASSRTSPSTRPRARPPSSFVSASSGTPAARSSPSRTRRAPSPSSTRRGRGPPRTTRPAPPPLPRSVGRARQRCLRRAVVPRRPVAPHRVRGPDRPRLWDVETEVVHRTFAGHRGSGERVASRPEDAGGDVFASCGRDGALALWDRRDRGEERAFEREPLGDADSGVPGAGFGAHGSPVSGPISVVERAHEPLSRASPRGVSSARRVNTRGAAAARRGAPRSGASPERSPLRVRRRPRAPRADGGASVGRAGRVFSPPPAGWGSSSSLASRERGVTSVAFLHDGRVLASAGAADGAVKLWDVRMLAQGAGAPLAGLEDRELPVERGGVPEIVTRRARGVTALALAPRGCGARLCARAPDFAPRRVRRRRRRARSSVPSAGAQGAEFLRQDRVQPGRDARRERVVRPRGARVALGQADGPARGVAGPRGGGHRGGLVPQDFSTIASCADDDTARVWTIRRGERGEGGVSRERRGWGGEGAGWRGTGRGGGGRARTRAGTRTRRWRRGRRRTQGREGGVVEGRRSLSLIPRPSSLVVGRLRCRTPAAARERARAPPSAARAAARVSERAWIRAALEEGALFAAAARLGDDDARRTTLGGGRRARESRRARCGTRPATASGTASATGDARAAAGRGGKGAGAAGRAAAGEGRRAGGVRKHPRRISRREGGRGTRATRKRRSARRRRRRRSSRDREGRVLGARPRARVL